MKHLARGILSSLMVLAAWASSAMGSVPSAEIVIGREGLGPRHAPIVLELYQSKPAVRCKAPGMPLHRIEVEGLKGVTAPFANDAIEPGCARPLSWRTGGRTTRVVKTCYRRGQNPVLDEVLRWCTSM